ncbi:MAG: hypothetical protein LBN27_10370 [Prevotellaceae bacterium]|jgi:hypothetical protein|nr:hypothetical protein [Prevotellaceae bacterium]
MKKKILFISIIVLILLGGIAVFIYNEVAFITITPTPAGKVQNIRYTIFSSDNFWELDSTEILKPNAALLITDEEEMKEDQELFLAEQTILHLCGYHYRISFWYNTDSLYSSNSFNNECEQFSYEPLKTRKRLDYYAKKLFTKPTHYIYNVELSDTAESKEVENFLKDKNLMLFLYPKKYQNPIWLLDTSSDIEEVRNKLKECTIIKEISVYGLEN